MGWFSSTWDAIKSVGKSVASVVKKVYEVCTSDSATEAYDRLERVINHYQNQRPIPSPPANNAPDFWNHTSTGIEKKLSEQNQQIIRQDTELKDTKRVMALQIELTRLRGSADLIDRAMKNVKIHASSLSVHYQNMRNINGLIDDVNNLRYGLKTVISTINYNANLISSDNTRAKKIDGIDLEIKEGAISQVAAYDAFDRTRELLRTEVIELASLSKDHLNDIERLKGNAANLGGDLGSQIINFLDRQIIPIIKQAESAGLLLKSEVSKLPAAVREKNGYLVFENGNIKLEDIN